MRLIDADALKKTIGDMPNDYYGDLCIGDALNEIDDAPTIDPVKRGEWKPIEEIFKYSKQWRCSVCEMAYLACRHNYCPNCGAKMESKA